MTSATIFLCFICSTILSVDIMDEEDRPRKLPKLEHGGTQEDLEPAMTGAIGGAVDPDEAGDEGSNDEGSASPVNDGNVSVAPADQEPTSDGQRAEAEPKLSKNQLKKRRRQEQWEAAKVLRRAKRKEKIVEKRERKRAELEEAKQQGTEDELLQARKAAAKPKARDTTLLPVTFVMDCGFDDLMMDKERTSLGSQITRSYSENSKAPFRGHLIVSSFEKLLKERFDTVLGKTHKNWKRVRFMQEDYLYAAEKAKELMGGPQGGQMAGMFTEKADANPEDGEIVYLSSESPDTLTELKPYSTYIIGGLVDKNRYKGLCYKRAMDHGIKTAKLPIGDYIQMASRQVLTTNHVMEIMLRWLELGDWGKAFMQVIPQRKGGSLKEQEEEEARAEAEAGAEAEEAAAAEAEAEAEGEDAT